MISYDDIFSEDEGYFGVVHSWEGLGPEHRHGSSPVERHGLAEAVLRR